MIGSKLGHYLIKEKIGEGGMGVVYKAEDSILKRTVALKFIKQEALGNEEEKARFLREAQAAAALDHPNICTVYEICEIGGQNFISMSYIDGKSLEERIQAGPLKQEEAINIAIQIAEGLEAAHEKGIVHRDIKSGNIMLTSKGQVKIMDFGLAKLPGQIKITREGSTPGTAAYMSPEQARGEEVDSRADIWSFGVVLYEMLTGQLPFKGDADKPVLYSILHNHPTPIFDFQKNISIGLENIINKTLTKNLKKRYQTISDMLNSI